jgi:MoaD family protein
MDIRVVFFGAVRDVLKTAELRAQLPEAASVGTLLEKLGQQRGPAFRKALFAEDGTLWPTVAVLVNGTNIALAQGLATTLRQGDEVAIVPVIAGG